MIRLVLPYPPSANRYWRVWRNRAVLTDEARSFKRTVKRELAASVTRYPKPLRLGIRLRVYRPQKSGDLDNREKVTLDALQDVAYDNDSQIVEKHSYLDDDPVRPRVEAMVWVVGEPNVQAGLTL